jgi:uncharacterized protein (DUF1697 family)
MRYIVLLRGVMPTGKNKLKMADLREVLTEARYEKVQTYIQSGNVILESGRDKDTLSEHIHQVIKEKLGPDLTIVVKTLLEFEQIIDENPFKSEEYSNRVTFCAMYQGNIDENLKQEVESLSFEDEYLIFGAHALYYFLPNGAHGMKISNNFLERKLKTRLTSRNQNTMEKLLTKAMA